MFDIHTVWGNFQYWWEWKQDMTRFLVAILQTLINPACFCPSHKWTQKQSQLNSKKANIESFYFA